MFTKNGTAFAYKMAAILIDRWIQILHLPLQHENNILSISSNEKSVTRKNIANKISDNFCLPTLWLSSWVSCTFVSHEFGLQQNRMAWRALIMIFTTTQTLHDCHKLSVYVYETGFHTILFSFGLEFGLKQYILVWWLFPMNRKNILYMFFQLVKILE